MKKRRLLSLLLTAALIISSLPMAAIAAAPSLGANGGGGSGSSGANNIIVAADEWLANNASVAETEDTDANGDGKYIHVSANKNLPGIGFYYVNSSALLKAGKTYALDFSVRRTTPVTDNGADKTNVVRLEVKGFSFNNYSSDNKDSFTPVTILPEHDSKKNVYAKDTWTEYTHVFTVGANDIPLTAENFSIRVGGGYQDTIAFDIDGLSLYEAEATVSGRYVPVKNAVDLTEDYLNTANYTTNAPATVEIIDTETFYAPTAGTTNTVITAADTTIELEPGLYTLTGDFRFRGLEFNDLINTYGGDLIKKNLTAAFDGNSLGTVAINTNDWTTAEFTMDLPAGGDISDLAITFDVASPLEYKNLELVYAPYNVNDDWVGIDASDNGISARYIDNGVPGFSYYRLSTSGIIGETAYNMSLIPDADHQFAVEDYILSFSVRNDPKTPNASNSLTVLLGSNYSDGPISKTGVRKRSGVSVTNVTSITKDGVAYTGTSALHSVTAEWIDYVISFELLTTKESVFEPNVKGLMFMIEGDKDPVNITNISLTAGGNEVDISDFEISGLIENGGSAYYQTKATVEDGYEIVSYYTTDDTGAEALEYVGSDATEKHAGSYTISAAVRASTDTTLAAEIKGVTQSASLEANKWENVEFNFEMRQDFYMSDISIDLGGASIDFDSINFKGVECEISEEWKAVDESGNETNTCYLDNGDGFTYYHLSTSTNASETAYNMSLVPDANHQLDINNYVLSFSVRNDPSTPSAANTIEVKLGSNYSDGYLTYTGTRKRDGVSVMNITSITKNGVAYIGSNGNSADGKHSVTADWTDYVIEFELLSTNANNIFTPNEKGFLFMIAGDRDPVNIANISLSSGGNELDLSNYILSGYTEGGLIPAKVKNDYEYKSYYTTNGNNAMAIKPISLEQGGAAGIYTLTGKVRASAATTLKAMIGSEVKDSVEVGTVWKDISLAIDVRDSFDPAAIKFSFEGAEYIDFVNLTLNEGVYTSLEGWEGAGGEMLVLVIPEDDFNVIAPANSYSTSAAYTTQFQLVRLPAGSYRISFAARNDASVADLPQNRIFVGLGGWNSGHSVFGSRAADPDNGYTVISSSIDGIAVARKTQFPTLTGDWKEFVSEIETTKELALNFGTFKNDNDEYGPINIRDFTITDLSTGRDIDITYAPTSNGGIVETAIPYYTTEGSGATAIVPSSAYTLAPGKYNITGTFRASNLNTQISASAAGSVLKTSAGADNIVINERWTKVTFELDLVKAISANEISFMFSSDIDFLDDIEIKLVEKRVSISEIDTGTLITLLLLKKAYGTVEVDETNLASGAISRSGARKWQTNGQTLNFVRDNDGGYLAARDIKNNTAGFIYSPATKLKTGMYIVSLEMRTANEGEIVKVRVSLNGTVRSATIDNEWQKIEFMYETDKKTDLVFKVFGGPTAKCVLDYDFKNLSIMNTDDVPGGYNLYENGDFSEETINGFYLWYGAGKIVRLEENGNGYMSVIGRDAGHNPARNLFKFQSVEGATYTISYDIRASREGDEFTVRAYMNDTALLVENPSNTVGNEFDITHEWRHVETTYVSTTVGDLVFDIKGGQQPGDESDFDVDNIRVIKKGGASDDDLYPAGNMDDKSSALRDWYSGYGKGHATVIWNEDGNGDGYITVTGRKVGHAPVNIKPIVVTEGKTYIISYDVRATNEGDEFTVRAYANDKALTVTRASNAAGNEFDITHEWRHVESRYIATATGTLEFSIKGGQVAGDERDFDLNNFKIALAD